MIEMSYVPPYTITDDMLSIVSEITEHLGQLAPINDLAKMPKLRRINRIRSIRSSLAIEHNSLSIEQVSDILNGKRVIGPPNEIHEVKNAINAYEILESIDPYNISDLLKTHKLMTDGLIKESGTFRKGEEGVFAGDKCIHYAPPAKRVPELMNDLFEWINTSKAHPLILSSVFHYEFEFIHPFADGNGRMGRFWQTALLKEWKPIFAWIPVESIILERQAEYYQSISDSTSDGNSNKFILFILNAMLDAILDLTQESVDHLITLDIRVNKLISIMPDHPMTSAELMTLLGLKSKSTFLNNYLQPALDLGLIEMTIPEKPTSRNQRYIKKIPEMH